MKNTIGNNVTLTLFGESHGAAVGCVLDGIAPGVAVCEDRIKALLSRRRPSSSIDTPRQEKDNFKILSGVFQGKTTGTPIAIVIENENTKSSDYNYGPARPSHADYAAYCKYHGSEDYRGGGHFSGRITAALVAAGGILIPMLEELGIGIATHILSCGRASDRAFEDVPRDISILKERSFPTFSAESEEKITAEILSAREDTDSIGGKTQTAVSGVPAGVGEPWFDSVEGLISHAVFSLGGVKGIEFGLGFGFSGARAGDVNDEFRMKDGKVTTDTNNNGGINGGITNGMPIIFNCAVKPTPSIAKVQKTVNFNTMTDTDIEIKGRHDPAIIRRICPVIDSVTALVIADLLATRFGTDALCGGIK